MEKVKIGNYVKQIRGVSYKPNDLHNDLNSDSVILLRANNINEGKINFDDIVYVDKSKVKKEQYLKKGDILVCASSGSKELVGKAAFINKDYAVTFGAFCKLIRPKDCIAGYLGHYFNSQMYKEKISSFALGANINNIRNEHIDELLIYLPNKAEQQNISILLDEVSDLTDKRKKQLEKLGELVKSRFIEMFGDPVSNPYGLPVVALGELSELITKGASPSWQGFSYTDDSSQTLFVTSENVREGYIDLSSPKYIEDGFNEKQRRSVIHKGDFLINIVGASIGRAAQFNLDCKANMNQASALVRIKDDRVSNKYLLIYLNSEKAQMMYDSMKSDTGRANLSLQDISNLSILLPPIEQQAELERFVEQTDKSKFEIKQSLEKLELLKKALMQKYFG